MSQSDKGFMGFLFFVSIWVILCAGEPDLLDAISKRVAQDCSVEGVEK